MKWKTWAVVVLFLCPLMMLPAAVRADDACSGCTADCIDEVLAPFRARGWLGLGLHAQSRGGDGPIVEIARIYEESPAERADLIQGDRILRIGESDLTTWDNDTLQTALDAIRAGNKVKITFERDGKRQEVILRASNPSFAAEAEWLGRHLLHREQHSLRGS